MFKHRKNPFWRSALKESQLKTLLESKPILSGILRPLKAIPLDLQSEIVMKMYCTSCRNFTNTALRKVISRLAYLKRPDILEHFKRFWSALRLVSLIEPMCKELCYHLLRNGWSVDYQLMYKSILELDSSIKRLNLSRFDELMKTGNKNASKKELENIMFKVDPQYWIPTLVFPRFDYSSKEKMSLSLLPEKEMDLPRFRNMVRDYIRRVGPTRLFAPSPDFCIKLGSSKYNDGGVVRTDNERATRSVDCGFLYQKFNPKPLATREVWLPDRATKLSNTFWMILGRQFLKNDPIYPDDDPRVTHDRIKRKLGIFGLFDISGFGFQYPRPLLSIVAQEISYFYSNPDISEQVTIFERILNSVKVEMPNGTFIYPNRGIGLGYYEDLKTIGMLAILADLKPFSVYGDQGLVEAAVMDQTVERLREFNFIIEDHKMELKASAVRWSGWQMSKRAPVKPKLYFESLLAIFSQDYHWERKQTLMSFHAEYPDIYKKWDSHIPFLYELSFGYEFQKGDSLRNFQNSGCSSESLVRAGDLRSWASEKLFSPKDYFDENFLYETPFFTEVKRTEAKAFSLKRKNVYRNSSLGNTILRDYVYPKLELLKTKKPQISRVASCASDALEAKLILYHGISTGKFSFGLNAEDMVKAITYCSRARNPYEAYATGGYRVLTPWRGPALQTPDQVFMLRYLTEEVTAMSKFMVEKFDSKSPPISIFKVRGPNKRNREEEDHSDLQPRPRPDTEVVSGNLLDFDVFKRLDAMEDQPRIGGYFDALQVQDIVDDIKTRTHSSTDLPIHDQILSDNDDDELYLEELEEVEEDYY
jgi:hypothetical protein